MRRNRLTCIALLFLCLCQMQLGMQVAAQTVVVRGTVSTSTATVRNASVLFEEKDNPSDTYATLTDSTGEYQISINLTSVGPATNLPVKFQLEQNYPNPFSSSTAISYELEGQADIRITIYDILGRVVREAIAGGQTAGTHRILWDGSNTRGEKVAAGVYFYSLQAGNESQVRKMVLNGAGGGNLSLAQSPTPPMERATLGLLHHGLGVNFTVRIENTANTFPIIISRQFDDVIVESDTSIDFSVSAVPVATVYFDSVQQYIRGFGGANIIPWRPPMSAAQMQKAFGVGESELGFTILRLRIPFTDDVNEFSAQLQVAQLAQSHGAIVFASPWTPPPSLKSNSDIVGGTLNESSYAAYAAHLKGFADYMATNGAPLYAVSLQNEPDANVTYESCYWNATHFLNFMKNNAAAVGTPIMMPESMNFNHALSDPTLNDSSAAANVTIIGGHIYGGGLAPYSLAVSKGKEVWMTEHLDLDSSWTGVFATGREIHDCMNAGMNAYVWWYIVRFYGPIGEDGNVTKRGYVMSQYARFVRPGFYKIKCFPPIQRYVFLTSYKNNSSSKVVIVALNTGASPLQQAFSLTGGSITSVTSYTTSQTKNCEQGSTIPVTGGGFVATLDPSSITTFVSN
jgi:glucuronoarabinoxylan endo-1,4-beta-xylanase